MLNRRRIDVKIVDTSSGYGILSSRRPRRPIILMAPTMILPFPQGRTDLDQCAVVRLRPTSARRVDGVVLGAVLPAARVRCVTPPMPAVARTLAVVCASPASVIKLDRILKEEFLKAVIPSPPRLRRTVSFSPTVRVATVSTLGGGEWYAAGDYRGFAAAEVRRRMTLGICATRTLVPLEFALPITTEDAVYDALHDAGRCVDAALHAAADLYAALSPDLRFGNAPRSARPAADPRLPAPTAHLLVAQAAIDGADASPLE